MQGLLALQPAATCPIKLNALGHYQGRGGGVFKSSPIPTVHNPSFKTAAKHTKLQRLLQGRVVSSCWLTTVVTQSQTHHPLFYGGHESLPGHRGHHVPNPDLGNHNVGNRMASLSWSFWSANTSPSMLPALQ